ncbi:MAG TPA: DinB family protein [Candidatus Dormibacteraeota bacterium]|nr:DinB family protein [Candidatus Dormibacteraeota bacterium]
MSQQVLTELLRGKGAHADPLACVEDLPADLAQRHIPGFPHSIGQLVFHMNYWLNYELKRIRGKRPKYPEHAAESFPPDASPANPEDWDRLKRDLSWFLSEFARLAQSPRAELDRPVESAREDDKKIAGTVEAVLWQMVAHTSYHTGQIALIRRTLNAWPPKAGGDTW